MPETSTDRQPVGVALVAGFLAMAGAWVGCSSDEPGGTRDASRSEQDAAADGAVRDAERDASSGDGASAFEAGADDSGAADTGTEDAGSGADGSVSGSTRIVGIEFDWTTLVTRAPGSDNWPLTWCEDDHQYTSWGDGGGFGGTNRDGRVSLGFARIEGDYPGFVGVNVWGGSVTRIQPPSPENRPLCSASTATSMPGDLLEAMWGPLLGSSSSVPRTRGPHGKKTFSLGAES